MEELEISLMQIISYSGEANRCALKHCKAIVMVIKKLAESSTRMPRKISIQQSGHTAGF